MRRKLVRCSLACATLFLALGTLPAQERLGAMIMPSYSPTFSFGMIGLGMAATARLNVINLVRTPPPIMSAIAQAPCKVELDVYDGQNKLVKQKTIANLGFGQADFLDVARAELAATGTHVNVTAVVKVTSSQPYFCNLSPTLEVFDSVSGNTTAILTPANPAPQFLPFTLNTTSPGQPSGTTTP